MTKRYLIKLGESQLSEPILAECILETGSKINILRADANGNILIRFPAEDEEKVLKFLKDQEVNTSEEKNVVKYDENKCVDCGHCISICPTKAFSFDENNKLIYDEDKCVLCGLCINACPRRALSKPQF